MIRLVLAGSLLAAPIALLALDLSPVEGVRQLEGFQVPVVTFSDGGRSVRWQPPAKWQLSGGQEKLVLSPPAFAQATMELQILKRPPDQRDRLATAAERQAWAVRFLPREASEVTQTAENSSPFTLRGQPSLEQVFQYAFQARRFSSSISFVDLNERERLVLTITSRQGDFAAMHEAAISSMFSWTWLE